MSFAVKSVVRAKVSGYESSDDKAVDLSFTHSVVTDFSSGTGSGKANEAWNDTRTVSSGSSEDLDLAGGLVRGTLRWAERPRWLAGLYINEPVATDDPYRYCRW